MRFHIFRRIGAVMVFMGALFTSGCATIVSGSTQLVSFTSNPEGATIELDGRTLGKAPLTVTIKKKSGQRIAASLPGYKTVALPLETRQNGWFWGNIVFGGFVGSTTDGISGAVTEYSPSHYMISLPREGSTHLDSQLNFGNEQKIKEFVVISYRQLVDDLRKGQGEYRDSLLSLLGVPPEGRDDAARKLLALTEAYPAIPDFAERVLDLAKTSASPAPSEAPQSAVTSSDIKDTFSAPEKFYDALCALPLADQPAAASRAAPPQREALVRYIVGTKGEARAFGWAFDIGGYLKTEEKECINRFLRDNSGYKPNF